MQLSHAPCAFNGFINQFYTLFSATPERCDTQQKIECSLQRPTFMHVALDLEMVANDICVTTRVMAESVYKMTCVDIWAKGGLMVVVLEDLWMREILYPFC